MDKILNITIDPPIKPCHDFDIREINIKSGQKFLFYKGVRYMLVENENQGMNSVSFIMEGKNSKLFLKLSTSIEHISFGLTCFCKLLDYGTGSYDGDKRYYYILEYVEGTTINSLSRNGVILDKRYYYEILDIIRSVNRAGYLFWDSNMSNFIINNNGDLICADYGAIISLRDEHNYDGYPALNCATMDLGIKNNEEELKNNKSLVELAILFDCFNLDKVFFDSEEINYQLRAANNSLKIKDIDGFKNNVFVKQAIDIIDN